MKSRTISATHVTSTDRLTGPSVHPRALLRARVTQVAGPVAQLFATWRFGDCSNLLHKLLNKSRFLIRGF